MNYYEHHIGDFAEATSHLTFVEDAAYSRMIRKYYATEKPLPPDKKAVQRLIGARTKEEKVAVDAILEEFFNLESDGWHNKRCDEELEKFQDGATEREARNNNEKERLKRHREERSTLFEGLRKVDIVPKWDIPMPQLREMHKRYCNAPETPPETVSETGCNGSDTAIQSPVTNTHTQTPDIKTSLSQLDTQQGSGPPRDDSLRKVQIANLLTPLGISPFSSDHEQCIEWASKPSITDQILKDAVAKAKPHKPGKISPNYLAPIVEQILAEQAESPSKSWFSSSTGITGWGASHGIFQEEREIFPDFKNRVYAEARRLGEVIP